MTEVSKNDAIDNKPLICPVCNKEFDEDCGIHCDGCEEFVCEDCIFTCRRCGNQYCQTCADECLTSCSECGEKFCPDCGNFVDDDSIEAEKFGAESICEDCVSNYRRRRRSRW